MFELGLLMAQVTDTIWTRLGTSGVAALVGVVLILTGVTSIQTRQAEETGKRRRVNQALGRSNSYSGTSAVLIGWLRVILGVAAIIFAIVFLFTGPMLAR